MNARSNARWPRWAFLAFVGALVTAAGGSFAQIAHGPHVHGQAQLAVAVDGSLLHIELHTPGYNFLGFEHLPATDAQLVSVLRLLGELIRTDLGQASANPSSAPYTRPILLLDAAAGCRLTHTHLSLFGTAFDIDHSSGAIATTHLPEAAEHDHEQEQEPADEHDHAETAVHGDIEAQYEFECRNIGALRTVDLRRLFESYPYLEQLVAVYLLPNQQSTRTLRPSDPILRMR